MPLAGARRQHGVFSILAALWLAIALAALGAIDIGNVYFVRRQLQRTADLAAMAGVQVIGSQGGCTSAKSAATANATANGFTADNNTTFLTSTCGRWDTTSSTYFGTSGNPQNAVQVQATQAVPYYFLAATTSHSVTATSTAYAANIDAFSLGTGIATINTQQSTLLNAILGGLLGSTVALSIGDTQSLATAHIKLQDLMVALGASTMQQLLTTSVSYQKMMVAMANALTAGGDTVNAGILRTLAVAVPGGQNITVGDGLSTYSNGNPVPGLLALGLANANSAATATINAFDALMVAAQIAQASPDGTAGNAPAINVVANLAGVAGISLQIINPPALAAGDGASTTVNGKTTYSATARTAVIYASINLLPISLPTATVGGAPLLAVTLSALSTPLVVTIQAAPGTAGLSSVDCETTKAATNATIQVTPGIASACVAGDASCTKPVNLVSLSAVVLGVTVPVGTVALNPTGFLKLAPGTTTPLVFDGSSGSFDASKSANSNAIGSDGSVLTSQLLGVLPKLLQVIPLGINLSTVLAPILTGVTSLLMPILNPVFGLLDSVFVPTLSLLGVQIGTATVHNMSLTCGVSQLVN